MTTILLIAFALLAGRAHAHSVPIDPSLCTFDPVEISAPATGFDALASPPGAADPFRIVWDPGMSRAQLCAADPADPANRCAITPPERAFSGGAVSGTLRIPLFGARVLASGDIVAAGVPVAFTEGTASENAFVTLTTGLAAAGDVVAAGSPIAADGRFTLVGSVVLGTMPPPLGGTPALLRMTCAASPPPDLDQFIVPTRTTKIGGRLATDGGQLRIAFRAGAEAAPPDFTPPALLRVASGDVAVAALALPQGLRAEGRKFVGQTADGRGSVTLRRVRRERYKMSVQLATAVLPATTGPIPVEVVWQAGGLLSRGSRTFRAGSRGLRAR